MRCLCDYWLSMRIRSRVPCRRPGCPAGHGGQYADRFSLSASCLFLQPKANKNRPSGREDPAAYTPRKHRSRLQEAFWMPSLAARRPKPRCLHSKEPSRQVARHYAVTAEELLEFTTGILYAFSLWVPSGVEKSAFSAERTALARFCQRASEKQRSPKISLTPFTRVFRPPSCRWALSRLQPWNKSSARSKTRQHD